MISALLSTAQRSNIIISTGNILSGNQKAARNSNEEMMHGLKQCLENAEINNLNEIHHRNSADLQQKINENERSNISIGVKIFLNNKSAKSITDAIESLLKILKVNNVDNVILAYPSSSINGQTNSHSDNDSTTMAEGDFKKSDTNREELNSLWNILEEYALDKKICRIGVSDLDTETLTELYTNSKVHPSIAQISLASCCVVPPSLQEFCNQNDIQLLTHSDNEIILNDEAFPAPGYKFDWAIRYQVHVKCRGVLAAKGYIFSVFKHS